MPNPDIVVNVVVSKLKSKKPAKAKAKMRRTFQKVKYSKNLHLGFLATQSPITYRVGDAETVTI